MNHFPFLRLLGPCLKVFAVLSIMLSCYGMIQYARVGFWEMHSHLL